MAAVNDFTTDLKGDSVEVVVGSEGSDSPLKAGWLGEEGLTGSAFCSSAPAVPGSAVEASGMVCCWDMSGVGSNTSARSAQWEDYSKYR